jgi:hypothetical protein
MGKTRVAWYLFKRMHQKNKHLKILISTWNETTHLKTWHDELKIVETIYPGYEYVIPNMNNAKVLFVKHSQLKKAISNRSGSPIRKWLQHGSIFCIVDEIHRAKPLRIKLSDSYFTGVDTGLPKWLKNKQGRKSKRIKWVLLSATPYNPVCLDYQLDTPVNNIAEEEENAIEKEIKVLSEEVKLTLGTLAKLDRKEHKIEEINNKIEQITNALRDKEEPVKTRNPLSIIPQKTEAFEPKQQCEVSIVPFLVDLHKSVKQLYSIHRVLADQPPRLACHTTTVERLILGGARANAKSISGHHYIKNTRKAVSIAQLPKNVGVPIKIDVLSDLVVKLREQGISKIVVFCTYRATATSVAKNLRKSLLLTPSRLLDASHFTNKELEPKIKGFNEKGLLPEIIITTDKLSEAINLHGDCHCLIHYELPWSPLRVIQRIGRLWRIQPTISKIPPAPLAYHIVHPCGIEEEILNRLKRRWSLLQCLGLDYMTKETALGIRVPTVKWGKLVTD